MTTDYRDQIAAERGISDEDRDLLLTGTDETTLLAQAERLTPLPKLTDGNIARREGQHVPHPGKTNRTMSDVASTLFGGSADPLD